MGRSMHRNKQLLNTSSPVCCEASSAVRSGHTLFEVHRVDGNSDVNKHHTMEAVFGRMDVKLHLVL
jgi:hypothetical protein